MSQKSEDYLKQLLERAAKKMRMFSLTNGQPESFVKKQYARTLMRIASGAINHCECCDGPMPVVVLNSNFFETTCSSKCKTTLQLRKLIDGKEATERELEALQRETRVVLKDEAGESIISCDSPANQTSMPNYNLDHVIPNKKKLILQYETAIQRFHAGTYGVCTECEEDISPARLDASPFSTRCTNCKTEIEESEKVPSSGSKKTPLNRLRGSVCV
jgi:DnaK suppressor protein